MSLFEHLRELRYRLVVAAVAIIVGMIACSFFMDELFAVLRHPYDVAIADLKARKPESVTTLVNQGITSPFTLSLKIAMVGGMLLTAPIWLYQLWAFIVPGLLAKEKKWAVIFISAATPLFFAGVAVGYIVMPKGISVLLGFTQDGITNMQDITQFLSFLLRIMVVFGIAFLIPLVVLMLNILGVIKARHLSKYRVYVIFGTFVFGAVATPSTDPFSMLALAAPMTLLFLAAEAIAHILDRRKERRIAAGEDVLIRDSVSEDKALRELSSSDGDDQTIGGAMGFDKDDR
ncbi:MAG: sec-independent protein translocase protein TatC [Propionibacteriaceae bacterium]|jgi:sec-independent protein translocase protein TatC|nr:tatC [Propionibacteriaceae bacterium]MDX6321656.1 sec-independent protein translocase protein TatC [Propionibacteriaceae bacterium]